MDISKTEGTEGNKMNSKSQLVIVFLIGFLLGLLIGPTFMGDAPNGDVAVDEQADVTGENNGLGDANDANTSPTTPQEPGANSIVASDQLAGERVVVDSVTLAQGGWAVVHESNEGAVANALGAQRFDEGSYENIYVDLLRNTETGNTYFVILYSDNGDGEFSLDTDFPLVETGETMIYTTFQTIQIDRKN